MDYCLIFAPTAPGDFEEIIGALNYKVHERRQVVEILTLRHGARKPLTS